MHNNTELNYVRTIYSNGFRFSTINSPTSFSSSLLAFFSPTGFNQFGYFSGDVTPLAFTQNLLLLHPGQAHSLSRWHCRRVTAHARLHLPLSCDPLKSRWVDTVRCPILISARHSTQYAYCWYSKNSTATDLFIFIGSSVTRNMIAWHFIWTEHLAGTWLPHLQYSSVLWSSDTQNPIKLINLYFTYENDSFQLKDYYSGWKRNFRKTPIRVVVLSVARNSL